MKKIRGPLFALLLAAAVVPVLNTVRAEEGMDQPKETILLTASEVAWTEAPASLPAGTKIAVLEGDPTKPGPATLRIKFPANSTINAHTHPADERVTVLSGTLYFGLGEIPAASNTKALAPGSFFKVPAGDAMYAFTTDEEVVVQLNIEGPWGMTYLETLG